MNYRYKATYCDEQECPGQAACEGGVGPVCKGKPLPADEPRSYDHDWLSRMVMAHREGRLMLSDSSAKALRTMFEQRERARLAKR